MELMSKDAQAILEEELASYKNKLVNRAVQYAERDGDTLIRDKQIMAAIRDYRNPEVASMQKKQRKEKTKILMATSLLLVLMLLIWLAVSVIYLAKDTQEKLVFLVGLMASMASLLSVILYYFEMRKGGKKEKSETVVSFIEKWNEFESLLRYVYKRQNKGRTDSLVDMIEYYLNTFSENKDVDERIIVNNLRIRNSIIHRGVSRANEGMLERNMLEMDKLIEKMKV